ncbi:hypothetical protein [Luteolibacter soli]|uniref:Uncharacterized protein n=1 Tax=Luteolibacter soli TaxID=3135280 RepID=A0ABU9B4M6_9BACT
MEIFPECGRIVDVAPAQPDPLRYAPIVHAYEEMEPGRVRIRLSSDSEWREFTYRMEGEIIYWTWGGKEWPWELISDDEVPRWFRGLEAKARQRMDEREAAAAAKKPEAGA